MSLLKRCFLLCCVCFISCSSEDKTFDRTNFNFNDLTVKESQDFLYGKWKIIEICGGVVGCREVENVYYLFEKDEAYSYIDEEQTVMKVVSWNKNDQGCEIVLDEKSGQFIVFEKVVDDILYFNYTSEGNYPVFTYTAVRDN